MIKTVDVTFEYESADKKVLDNVSLAFEEGTFTAILGRNGSGKSTLAKHFNAILLPSGGKVYIDELDTSNEKHTFDIRRRVGMVFQNPDNQIVAATVEEDVAFGLENLMIPREEMTGRVRDALKAVGMYEKRMCPTAMLSGGQKQRAAIAGIIAMAPKTIVFDEPTAMLDPKGRREVMAIIKKLKEDFNITVIMITHYMDEAAKADRVVVIDKGKTVLDGTPRAVFSDIEKMKRLGLDVPQVTLLCYELKKRGVNIRGDIIRSEECAREILEILERHDG